MQGNDLQWTPEELEAARKLFQDATKKQGVFEYRLGGGSHIQRESTIDNLRNHEAAISAISAYAPTIQGKNLTAQEVSDRCVEVNCNIVVYLKKISVDSDGKA